MKKLLLCILFISGCVDNVKVIPFNNQDPKFKVGDHLKITTGFYQSAEEFTPEYVRKDGCLIGDTLLITWIYKGQVHLSDVKGEITNVEVCEKDLKLR